MKLPEMQGVQSTVMRPLVTVALLGILPVAYGAAEIRVIQTRTCDAAGNYYVSRLGERLYGIRVDWSVTGTPTAPYDVQFEVANQRWTYRVNSTSAGNHYVYGLFSLPLDGPIPTRVSVDETGASGDTSLANNVISGDLLPQNPTRTLEFFNPMRLRAQQSFTVEWNGGQIDSLAIYLGLPTTESSQQLISRTLPTGADLIGLDPSGYPVSRSLFTNVNPSATTATQQYTVDAYASRVNYEQLRTITWNSYTNLPASINLERQAEPTLESTGSVVTDFVARSLPSNYRTSLRPAEAARQLYLATCREMTLDYGNGYTAANGITNRGGDPWTFQRVYQAALRNIGIPARSVAGWSLGNDFGEAWTEVYFPGAGWVPQDVAVSEMYDPTGTYAYCFATVPYLNERTITQRGSRFVLEGFTLWGLLPGNFVYRGNASFTNYYGRSTVVRG